MNISRRAMLIFVVLLVAAITVGIGYAAETDRIYACVDIKKGKLRIVNAGTECGKKEKELNWSKEGNGAEGPQGPAGQDGAPGGVSGWEIVNSGMDGLPIGVGGKAIITVTCPSGKKVLGGGGSGQSHIALAGSWPIATNQWAVTMWNMHPDDTQTAVAFAVCADATP